jgi:tetratricopeptide (TPR) repeat protein/predicted nucleic acid-binding protein
MISVAILDGVISNLLFAVGKGSAKALSSIRVIKSAIASTAAEVPYSDVARVLSAWVDAVDLSASERFSVDAVLASQAIENYGNIARVAGSPSDEAIATEVLERFAINLDRQRRIDLAEHDGREAQRHSDTRKLIEETTAENTKAIIAELQRVTNSTTGTLSKLSSAAKLLASIEGLIDAGQFTVADNRLKRLTSSELENFGIDDKVSYHTFCGICFYHLNDFPSSVQAFQIACALKPESSKTSSNLAAAYLASDDGEGALKEAQRSYRLDPAAPPINLVASLHARGRDPEALALIDAGSADWNEDAEFLTATARVYIDTGRHDEAIEISRRGLALVSTVDAKETLAIALLSRHEGSRLLTPQDELIEAVTLLSDCIKEQECWQAKEQLNRLQANRAVGYCLLRDFHLALHDCDSILARLNFEPAHVTKFRALASLERWHEAINEFSLIKSRDVRHELTPVFANCLLHAKRATEALATIEQFIGDPATDADLLSAVHIGSAAALATKDVAAAESLIANAFPETSSWGRVAADGYLFLETGNVEAGVRLLRQALAEAPEHEALVIRVNIARALARAGRVREAASEFETFVKLDSDSELIESYGGALYRSTQYKKFVELYVRCEAAGIRSSRLRELRARVYEKTGELLNAAAILEQEADKGVQSSRYYLHSAQLHLRLGQNAKAKDLALRVDLEDVLHDAHDLMALAEIYDAVALGPLSLAYRSLVLSNGPHEPAAYVRLCAKWLSNKGEAIIGIGGVTVVLEDRVRTTITLSDDPLDRGLPDHHPLASAVGKALVGKRSGEFVTLAGTTQRIVSVTDKHLFALSNAIETSSAKHGRATRLSLMPPPSDGRTAKLAALRSAYQERKISIGRMARLAHRHLISTYSAQLVEPAATVEAFVGDEAGARAAIESIVDAQVITIDLTALITFARIGLLDQLKVAFRAIFVSQATVDELLVGVHEILFVARPDGFVRRGVASAQGVVPIDTYVHQHEIRILEDALTFVMEQATILGWPLALELTPREIVARTKKYGRVPFTSARVAAAQNALLVIDDVVSAGYAKQDGLKAVGSDAVLKVMHSRGAVATVDYEHALLVLRDLNYQFLRVSVGDLCFLLDTAAPNEITEFAALCGQLASPSCEVNSVISVASGVLWKVWLSSVPSPKKIAVTNVVLLATVLSRSPEIAYSIRDHFLTTVARNWQTGGPVVERIIREFLAAFTAWSTWLQQGLERIAMDRRRVRRRDSAKNRNVKHGEPRPSTNSKSFGQSD